VAGEPSELVSARYPLAESSLPRADLRFQWYSATGDVSPQMEVLLQVVVDVAHMSLLRVGSRLAVPAEVGNEVEADRVPPSARVDLQGSGP
jgi:hypothetical protein